MDNTSDIKNKLFNNKSIFEYAAGISTVGALLSVVVSVLFNFFFFFYFVTSVNFIPITISEVLKDAMILFPFLILIIPYAFLFHKSKESEVKQSENEKKESKIYKVILIISIVATLIIALFGGWWFIFLVLLAGIIAALFTIGKYEITVISFIGLCLILPAFLGYSYAVAVNYYNPFDNNIYLKDNTVLQNIKIIKVCGTGLFIIDNDNVMTFVYANEIKKYSKPMKTLPSINMLDSLNIKKKTDGQA